MKVSIVVPVYNAPGDVGICLASLARSLMPETDYELLLMDDKSGEETAALLRNFVNNAPQNGLKSVRLVVHAANRGYLDTCNEAFGLAQSDIAVTLNSDTSVPLDFLDRIRRCFAADPRIGLASPVASHCGLFSIPMKPGLGPDKVDVMDGLLKAHEPRYPDVVLPDGFCFCVRKTMLDDIGAFDPAYRPGYFEESDLGMRALRGGWRAVLIDNLYVYHKAQASFGKKRNRELVSRNEAVFMERWGAEYRVLREAHPREEQKKRLYPRIYSARERFWRKTVRFAASLIPIAEVRRRIRRAYN